MRQKFTLRCEYIDEETGERAEITEAAMEFPTEVGLVGTDGVLLHSWIIGAFISLGYHKNSVEKFFNVNSKTQV